MRWAGLVIIALSLAIGPAAHADSIDKRAKQLRSSSDYKVRLSAALWLAKKQDKRAVNAMIRVLKKEPERNIRRIAAKALSKMLTDDMPAKVRKRTKDALARAADKDKDKKVRKRAKQALAKLDKKSGDSAGAALGRGQSGIYVNIGAPNLGKHKMSPKFNKALQRAVSAQLKKKLPQKYYRLGRENTDKLPTKKQLKSTKRSGWFVGATVSKLKVTPKGNQVKVQCGVTMRVNPWTGADGKQLLRSGDTASAKGNAAVVTANNKREIGYAKEDCLLAVAEQITSNRVVPFLKQRGPVARTATKKKRVRVSRSDD